MSALLQETRSILDRMIAKRLALDIKPEVPGDIVLQYLFDKQLEVARSTAQFKTQCAGRAAGKTTGDAALLLRKSKLHPKRVCLYISLTAGVARANIWNPLKDLNAAFGYGGVPNESRLTLEMPNGAIIVLLGVDNRSEIEKLRGRGFAIVIIDECQSVPEYIRMLVDDVIAPRLVDVPGELIMSGTPALLPSGYWYECHHNPDPVWSHFSWTMWDNPHIPNPDASLAAECARRGVTKDDASIQREWFGRWIRDLASAVFAFSPDKNCYDVAVAGTWNGLPMQIPLSNGNTHVIERELWKYVIAVDLGGGVERDNDAISVLAFHPDIKCTWLTKEIILPKRDVSGICQDVRAIWMELKPERVVAVPVDTGGIGAKVAYEMSSRYGIPTSPAKKADKWTNIELFNAACRNGEFLAPKDSQFAKEVVKVEKDWAKSTPEKFRIKGHMPDIVDSVLYGHAESLAWLSKRPEPKPVRGTKEHEILLQKTILERARRAVLAQKQEKEYRVGNYGIFEQMDSWGEPLDIGRGWGPE